MVTRTATLRLQLVDSVSGPSKATTAALRNLEGEIKKLGKGGVPGAKRLLSDLDYLKEKSAAVGKFTELRRGMAGTFGEFRKARDRVKELEQALNSATKPTAKMRAELRTAQSALKQTTSAFNDQKNAALQAERALRMFGLNSRSSIAQSQAAIRGQMAQTIQKMRELDREARKQRQQQQQQQQSERARQQSRQPNARGGVTTGQAAAGIAGGYVASRGGSVAQDAFMKTVDFDQAKSYRDALGYDVFSDRDKEGMNKQAEKIGYETRFTNADVVKAQTGLLQAGIRNSAHIINAMQPITDYALAMGVTLEEATETVRSASQIKQIPLGDSKAVSTFVDSLVWMAKNAGMDNNDVRQYVRYGGASMKSIGLSDPVQAAMGVVLRRAGTPGDEAGVFTRTAAAKLGAPTNPGRMALQSMGLNYDDYVKWPEAFKVGGLSKMIQENFGTAIPEAIQKQIEDFIGNETYYDQESGEDLPVSSDRGTFVSGIVDRLAPVFKDMSAKDREALAKKIGDFHKMSAESVDAERLFMDIMKSNPSLAQLNAFFTQRQGNRAMMIAARLQEFMDAVDLMKKPPENITHTIGEKANEGLYGDWTRAVGAVETALIKVVQDWETPVRGALKGVDSLASEFTQLSERTRQLIEAFGFAIVALGGFAAMRAGKGAINKLLGKPVEDGASKSGASTKGPGVPRAQWGRGLVNGLKNGIVGGLLYEGGTAAIDGALGISPEKGAEIDEFTSTGAAAKRLYDRATATDDKGVPGWKRVLLGRAADPDYSFRQHMRGAMGGAQRDKDRAEGRLSQTTASWPAEAQQGIQGYIQAIATGGAEAEAKAAAIGEQIKAGLSVTGEPNVNTASLERALNLARQVADAIRAIGGMAPSVPSAQGNAGSASSPSSGGPATVKVDGARAKGGDALRGRSYLVGEDGEEIFSPDEDGTIIPNGQTERILSGGSAGSGPSHGGGAQAIHINLGGLHISGGNGGINEQQLGAMLDRMLRRSAQTAFRSLRYGEA